LRKCYWNIRVAAAVFKEFMYLYSTPLFFAVMACLVLKTWKGKLLSVEETDGVFK